MIGQVFGPVFVLNNQVIRPAEVGVIKRHRNRFRVTIAHKLPIEFELQNPSLIDKPAEDGDPNSFFLPIKA
jgi:hypothetical protein